MIEQPDQLDDALAGRTTAMTPEVHTLVDLATELASAFAGWRLTAADRARIHAQVHELVVHPGFAAWRRAIGRRAPALIGGAAAITVAAAVGIGVAVARGRRHEHALAA